MLFASVVSDGIFFVMFLVFMLLFIAKKIVCSVDDDGQIKEKASQGVVRVIERFLK